MFTPATRQYLRLARAHPPRTSSVIKAHLFKLLYLTLQVALRPGITAPCARRSLCNPVPLHPVRRCSPCSCISLHRQPL